MRFWWWGCANENLSSVEMQLIDLMIEQLIPGGSVVIPAPELCDFQLPPPRVSVPSVFQAFTSVSTYDRLMHSFGKSYADLVRMLLRQIDNPPDWVCFPRDESHIEQILAYATKNNMAVIPFGVGTSVCGAVR
ncbi:MAG: hypothetical protein OSA42_09275, partial [Porticoccaceae bacterium]|nr:hypothetical protein [Porticoccaceae bacterium]